MKWKRIELLFVCLLPFIAFSKESNVQLDSLKTRLSIAWPTEQVELCFRLSEIYRRSSLDSALHYAGKGLELAYEVEDFVLIAKAYDILGRSHFGKGNFILTTDCFEKGLVFAEKSQDPKLIAHLNNSLGVIYSTKGDYSSSLPHLLAARDLWVTLGDKHRNASILINIGVLNLKLKKYEKAIISLNQALELSNELEYDRATATALNNLGQVYEALANYEKALSYYKKAYLIKKKDQGEIRSISVMANIFSVYSKLERFDEANKYYDDAMALAAGADSKPKIQQLHKKRGEVLLERNQLDEALLEIHASLEIAQVLGSKSAILDLHKLLADTYTELKDYEKGLFHQIQYGELKDSIFSEKNQKEIAQVEARYALSEKEKEIRQLRIASESERYKFYVSLVAMVLFLIALGALYSRIRLKNKSNQILEQRNLEIQHQNDLLEKQNQQIEKKNDLLQEQSRAINIQHKQLTQSYQDLEQFAYAASHDLREPLRTIRSYMQLLEKKYSPQLDKNAREFIEYATDGAIRMDELLKDLLLYSRIGRSKIIRTDVLLKEIVDQVKQDLGQQILDTDAKIIVGDLPILHTYRPEMYLLFLNLVSNGIKFHREGFPPVIQIKSKEIEPEVFLISISDNGIGIDKQYFTKVFTIFQRLHSRAEYQGTGIGLATCKKIVQNHGGEIWVESELGQGTSFFVKIPLLAKVAEA